MNRYRIIGLCAIVLASIVQPGAVFGWGGWGGGGWGGGGTNSNSYKYHIIIDYTQGYNLDPIVTNTQAASNSSTLNKQFPLMGTEMPPQVAINPDLWPSGGAAKPTPDLYVTADTANSDITYAYLTTATDNTCDQGKLSACPDVYPVPITFVHRLGTYDASTGQVTPLINDKLLPSKQETISNLFSTDGQAFNIDRMRYVANRLWYQWYSDVQNPSNRGSANWKAKFGYQPTGTMSFETFLDNIAKNRPMYGLVRVVIPVDSSGEMWADVGQPVNGAEIPSTTYQWGKNSATMVDDENLRNLVVDWSKAVYQNANPNATITIYGSLLMDYVDKSTYDPDHFFDASQDYVDNYASVSAHDAASPTGVKNFILPRTQSQTEDMYDNESLEINPTWVNTNNRVASADTAQTYMINGAVNFAQTKTDYPDAAVWEYWMRQAVQYPATNSTRLAILNDLTGSNPQYDYVTQTFTSTSASRLTSFNSSVWGTLAEKDQFHTYFPCGYEHGWMVAFDALRMDALDTTTSEKTAGSWWKHLPDMVAGTDSQTLNKVYGEFSVPGSDEAISVDADGDGTAVTMPNFFSSSWEDLPAFSFAGGFLDIHGFANIGGMLYTPDSVDIEPGTVNTASSGAQEYINGAIVAGDGIYIGGQTSANELVAISFNYSAFDRLKSKPQLTVDKLEDLAELPGL